MCLEYEKIDMVQRITKPCFILSGRFVFISLTKTPYIVTIAFTLFYLKFKPHFYSLKFAVKKDEWNCVVDYKKR